MSRSTALSKKAPKDLNAPKRPPSSYLLFTNERRSVIKAANPALKVTEISKAIGKEWGQLGDDGKQPYIARANELKAEWEKAMAEYKQTESWRLHQIKLQAWKQAKNDADHATAVDPSAKPPKIFTFEGTKWKEPKKPKDMKAPKKPQTAYFIFSNERRPALKEKYPEWKVTQYAKQLGQDWAQLNDEAKAVYSNKAATAKAEYARVYEEYKKSADYLAFNAILSQYNEELKQFKIAQKAFVRSLSRRHMSSSHSRHSRREESSSGSESDSYSDSESSGSGSDSDSESGSSSMSSD